MTDLTLAETEVEYGFIFNDEPIVTMMPPVVEPDEMFTRVLIDGVDTEEYSISSFGKVYSHRVYKTTNRVHGYYVDYNSWTPIAPKAHHRSHTNYHYIRVSLNKNVWSQLPHQQPTLNYRSSKRGSGILKSLHPLNYRSSKRGSGILKSLHQLVIGSFYPIDKHPELIGVTKDEWNNAAESMRNLARRSIYINHINGNGEDNRLINLEYSDCIKNIRHAAARKKQVNTL